MRPCRQHQSPCNSSEHAKGKVCRTLSWENAWPLGLIHSGLPIEISTRHESLFDQPLDSLIAARWRTLFIRRHLGIGFWGRAAGETLLPRSAGYFSNAGVSKWQRSVPRVRISNISSCEVAPTEGRSGTSSEAT